MAVWLYDWYSDDGKYHLSDVAVRLFKIGTVMMVNIICPTRPVWLCKIGTVMMVNIICQMWLCGCMIGTVMMVNIICQMWL